MISFKKSKSHIYAAIGTGSIIALLFGLLMIDYSGFQSSKLSELDDLILQLNNEPSEDIDLTPPGKNPLSDVKENSPENIRNSKGILNQQTPPTERTPEQQQADMANIPDTIPVKKTEITLTKDTVGKTPEDTVQSVEEKQLAKIQHEFSNSTSQRERALKEQEKYRFYKNNFKSIRDFKKVYPYALKTKEIVDRVNRQLLTMNNNAAKRKLINETERMLFKEYESAIRTMTSAQGRLLLKLIARETNKSGYQIIKDYKGAFPATFWYGIGRIFGTDLKTEYHRESQDSLVENILNKYKKNELY